MSLSSIARWRSRRMLDSRECRDDRKMSLIRRRVFRRTAPNPRTCRSTATVRATAHPTISIRELRLADRAHVRFGSKPDILRTSTDVRFSNRPVWVKRFQTIHQNSFELAREHTLLFGIGTEAL